MKTDFKLITKEQFDLAYSEYPPNGFIQFAFRYFSKSTKKEDSWLSKMSVGLLISIFLLGFIGTAFGFNRGLIGTVTYVFTGLLAVLVINLFAAVLMNNWRVRKICKKLGGISKYDYNFLVGKYLS
jgi:hypothetical protein